VATKKTTKKPADTKKRPSKSLAQLPQTAADNAATRARSTASEVSHKPTHQKDPGEAVATIDRREHRDRRNKSDRREKSGPVAVERRGEQRRAKVCRRRQIDPTTCERDYTPAEIEFMSAMDEYKRVNGRMFPTCSEVLEVIKKLGYEKCPQVEPLIPTADPTASGSLAGSALGYLPQDATA
jgi:hypothetical protein